MKHVMLCRIVEYLKRKDGAFRVIDTHAGTGDYNLASGAAQKTGEWRDGIGKLLDANLPANVAKLAAPYLDIVRAMNEPGNLQKYPGSPAIIRQLLRKQDRMTAIELHPEDAVLLKTQFGGDYQARILELDGWLALGAHVPPKEKRGLVLVDPPFEEGGEFDRIVDGLSRAHRRWPGGIYAFWYPVKDRAAVNTFRKKLAATDIPRILDLVLEIRPPSPEARLDGSGMIIVNPPYTLADEAGVLLPALAKLLGEDGKGRSEIIWVTGESRPVSD